MESYFAFETTKVGDHFIARHCTVPMATAVGSTKSEAGDMLAEAISEYVRMFPDRRDELLGTNVRLIDV